MNQLYPLRFEPLLKRYIWGGRRLGTVLGKPIGDETCAESWEMVDHGDDQSHVAYGPLAGTPLAELVGDHASELFGNDPPQRPFPLLLKFLDAAQDLSVQVHPNDEQAAELDPPDRGKTEAWVVVDAEPGSLIYAGLKRGVDRATFERETKRGTLELCLNRFEPKAGDCVFIPAGTVHALGAGLLVAEIQQSSDTTFRLFDWNRVGTDGKPRALHIEQALQVIRFDAPPVQPQVPQETGRAERERLVACDKFILDRWCVTGPTTIGGDEKFHILTVIDGSLFIQGDPAGEPLTKGQSMLLPASCGATAAEVAGQAIFLDAYLP